MLEDLMGLPGELGASEVQNLSNPLAISYSQVDKYQRCPAQHHHYYVGRYRLKYEKAHRAFGIVLHAALAGHFRSGADPIERFALEWGLYKFQPLDYDRYDSWHVLAQKGEALLHRFMAEERHRITDIRAVEKRFTLQIANVARPIVGVIDLLAKVDGRLTIVDFKTASQSFYPWEAELSDQLTTYLLAEPQAEQLAYCVFLKTKSPEIQWRFGHRELSDVAEYLDKVTYIIQDIAAGRFPKRSGRHCAWCDFRPLCLKEARQAADTLIQISSDPNPYNEKEVTA